MTYLLVKCKGRQQPLPSTLGFQKVPRTSRKTPHWDLRPDKWREKQWRHQQLQLPVSKTSRQTKWPQCLVAAYKCWHNDAESSMYCAAELQHSSIRTSIQHLSWKGNGSIRGFTKERFFFYNFNKTIFKRWKKIIVKKTTQMWSESLKLLYSSLC